MGLEVAIENMPGVRRSHFTAPGDWTCAAWAWSWTSGHANLTGTLSRFVNEHNGELRHLHLHDNGGHLAGDQHLALGAGVVDFAPALPRRGPPAPPSSSSTCGAEDVLASLRHLKALELLTPADAAASHP